MRPRPQGIVKPSNSPLWAALPWAASLLFLPLGAQAQDTGAPVDQVQLQLEQFEPRAAGSGLLNAQTGEALDGGALTLSLWTVLVDDPLRLVPVIDGDPRPGGVVVDQTLRVELLAGYGLIDGLQVSLALPLAIGLDEGDFAVGGRTTEQLGGTGLGDPRLSLTLEPGALFGGESLYDRWGVGLGLDLTAWLPVGSTERLEGEGSLRFEPRLLVSAGSGRWLAAADVGYHIRPQTTFFTLVNANQLKWRLGLRAPTPHPLLDVEASVFGAHHLVDQVDPADNSRTESTTDYDPVEAIGAVRWRVIDPLGFEDEIALRIGGGAGLTGGVGAPAWRVMLGLDWALPVGTLGPLPYDPDPDDDGVGEGDACPFEPETINGVRDEDGCPDDTPPAFELDSAEGPLPDADGDRVPDEIDLCPDAAEDRDGFEDGDGCPDADPDGDTVQDGVDKCPVVAENDGAAEPRDGCPAVGADGDGDGIGDSDDLCPTMPETVNGVRDWDGCPEGIAGRQGPEPDAPVVAVAAPLPPLPVARDSDGDGVADADDVCPDAAEDRDGFEDGDGCPEDDPDGDGIADGADRCPDLAETVNGFEDNDGCPDVGPDGDGDAVGDADDLCPLEPESPNGVRDHDGCPEAEGAPPVIAAEVLSPLSPAGDPDGDGVIGADDRCPTVPEDLDGFEDGDGCPELDDDGDGVADIFDRCAREAETINFYNDADGCPDRAPSQVAAIAGVVERIQFKVGRSDLMPGAIPVLQRVLGVMKRYPRLRLQIDGHTDSTGERERNFELSNDRAASVRAWLIARGVAAYRLSSFGYGPDRPLASNRDLQGRFKNRRVELSYSEPRSAASAAGGPP